MKMEIETVVYCGLNDDLLVESDSNAVRQGI